jgi:enoyl-CoA hydratase/carnithine racemase
MNFVISEFKERIAYIVLNRPEKRNALNAEFVEELKQAITEAEQNKDVRAIILKSSGEAF